ncbi:MAG: RAMP superfamily CRISPR-associated protein [Promethearchaeota archaeon]
MLTLTVECQLNNSLHIGSSFHSGELIDNPIISKMEESQKIPIIPANVIKGSVRNNAYIIFNSLIHDKLSEKMSQTNHLEPLDDPEYRIHPLVSLFGAPEIPGKLNFSEGKFLEPITIRNQAGILIDREYLSTVNQALFSYEIAEITKFSFEISALGLNDEELGILMGILNSLRFANIGGRTSTGSGIILNIKIKAEPEILQKANLELQKWIQNELENKK